MWHLLNPSRPEGQEEDVWFEGRVLLQSHNEMEYEAVIGLAASGFYGPEV